MGRGKRVALIEAASIAEPLCITWMAASATSPIFFMLPAAEISSPEA